MLKHSVLLRFPFPNGFNWILRGFVIPSLYDLCSHSQCLKDNGDQHNCVVCDIVCNTRCKRCKVGRFCHLSITLYLPKFQRVYYCSQRHQIEDYIRHLSHCEVIQETAELQLHLSLPGTEGKRK